MYDARTGGLLLVVEEWEGELKQIKPRLVVDTVFTLQEKSGWVVS